MSENTAELRREVIRLLDLADSETNPTMRDAFIRLAIYNYELAYRIETRAKAEGSETS